MRRFLLIFMLSMMTYSVIAPLVQQWQKGDSIKEMVEKDSNGDSDDFKEEFEKEAKFHLGLTVFSDDPYYPESNHSKAEIPYLSLFIQGIYCSLPFLPPEA